MAEAEIDDLDAEIAKLQAQRALKVAKAEALRKIEEKKARDILIGSTPTKGRHSQHVDYIQLTSQNGRLGLIWT
jgi:F0F1-type ATP synthase epsilon subunit